MIDIVILWLLIGFACIAIEFTHLPGIGLLFLGLAGLCNAILLYIHPELEHYQFAAFGLMALGWLIILWWPLKKFLYKNTKHVEYFELVGKGVEVHSSNILPGGLIQVKWSGTIMNAKLEQRSHETDAVKVTAGEKLIVQAVQGNILICRKCS